MGLAKYAEDNLEIFYERMAMKEYTTTPKYMPQYSKTKTTTKAERKDEVMHPWQCLPERVPF